MAIGPRRIGPRLAEYGERFDLLLGRRTYEAWSGFWLKAQDGPDLFLSGSSTLTSTLLEHGLADEVLLAVYPVLLGTGSHYTLALCSEHTQATNVSIWPEAGAGSAGGSMRPDISSAVARMRTNHDDRCP